MSQKSDVKRVGPKNDPKNRAALITGAALLVAGLFSSSSVKAPKAGPS
jgi:hypothetical protein